MRPTTPMVTALRRCAAFLMVSLLVATACGEPKDEKTGFALGGEPASGPVGDWRFTDEIEEIAIQTRTWYGLPHSATIWIVQVDGQLYVGSYGWAEDAEEEKKYWERNVARRPEARLRIDDKLYDVRVTPVVDAERVEALDLAYATKYDMADVFGEDLPNWWYYRASLRAP